MLLFCFFQVSQEYEKFSIILGASRGTDTQLVSHYLLEVYRGMALLDPIGARREVLSLSLVSAVLFLSAGWFVVQIGDKVIRLTAIALRFRWLQPLGERGPSSRWFGLCMIPILVPFVVLPLNAGNFHLTELKRYVPYIGMSASAAMVVLCVALAFSFCARYFGRSHFGRIGKGTIVVLVMLCAIRAVPTISLFMVGSEWLAILDANNWWGRSLMWGMSHVVLAFPLICAFLMVNHIMTSERELMAHVVWKSMPHEVFFWSFWKRYAGTYVVAYLFAISMIWTEYPINSLYSEDLPALVIDLGRAISGRAFDYPRAASIGTAVAAIPGVLMVAWWRLIARGGRSNAAGA